MYKKIVLFKDSTNDRQAFISYVANTVLPRILSLCPHTLKVTQTTEAPPGFSVIPFSSSAVACISITGDNMDVSAQYDAPHFLGAYRVTEAVPVAYHMDWPTERSTPGVCLLTLFNRKKNLTDSEFLNRWHNGHTPLSLKIHPLWNYVRNVVENTDCGLPFEGIVEEQVRFKKDLLNPARFFGSPLMMGINMVRTLVDTRSFIDYATMETYLAEETWILRG